jgi:predicted DNA-binding transcriptional regulator AlpA
MTDSAHSWKQRLNSAEAASYLGVSVATVRAWRLRGPDDPNPGPHFIRLSGSMVVYDLSALDEYLARKRAATYGSEVTRAA